MNCSAEKSSRKWRLAAFGRTAAALVTGAAAPLLMLFALAEPAMARRSGPLPWDATPRHAPVPLPRPRPAEASKAEPQQATAKEGAEEAAEPSAPQPSACRQALTEEIAMAPSIPAIHGPGACGGDDLVRLEAVVLKDGRKVAVKPAAILRCPMATAIADWVRSDVAPLAAGLGSAISELDNFDSFECRGRNRVAGAMLSEHGRANALDVRGFTLASGQTIRLTDRSLPRQLREDVLHSVCARFSTVLGPDSDWYHEDHIHLDLMERRNNYRICQWDVLDPLPQVAPLLPAARPEEAPPRQVAAKSDAAKSDGAKSEAEKSDAASAPEEGTAQAPPPTKKRRQSRRF